MNTRKLYPYLLYALMLGIFGMFLIWPIALAVQGGFVDPDGNFTLKYVIDVFRDPVAVQGLVNSFMIAVFTTIGCIALTLPLAMLATKFDFYGKTILTGLIMVPLILPPFVGAIGMRAILGRFGAINTFLGDIGVLDPNEPGIDFLGGAAGGRFFSVVVMTILHLYPITYLNITAALSNLDPTLDEAASMLGASRWKRFWTVTFPLIMPGIFAGSTIVFIWSFTELGTPLMFDYYTVTPVQIFWGISEMQASPRPYALVVVMLTASVFLYGLGKWAFGGRAYAMQSKASVSSGITKLTGPVGVLATLAFGGVIFIAVLPHLGVIFASLSESGTWYRSVLPTALTTEHFEQALTHPLAMDSIRNSLTFASIAVVLSVIAGLTVSYLTVRVKVKGGWMLDSLAMLPLAVPGLVMAFGYVAMSLKWPFAPGTLTEDGFLQVVGTNPNPAVLLIIAYAVRRLPYVVRAASAGLEQTSGDLEEAAQNLGASTATTLRRIVVPLIMANIIAGAILAFSFSMLEVSDSLILAQKQEHYPITKAIFELFNRLGDGPYIASAMGVWGMALLTVTLVGAGVLMGKRLGAIFRV